MQGDITLPLSYSFGEVGAKGADGVTATIPLAVLNRLAPRGFDWLVPGMREELVTELIRSLPKPIRRHLVPAPERAKGVAGTLHDDDPDGGEAFVEAVADELVALPGVPEDLPLYGPEFDLTKLPAHLRMHFRVVDGKGRQVGTGARRRRREPAVGLVARRGTDGRLERVDRAGLGTADEQALAHREGVIALIDREIGTDLSRVLNALPNPTKLAVSGSDYASTAALLADASRAATVHLAGQAQVRTRAEYEQLLETVRQPHDELAAGAVKDAAAALAVNAKLQRELGRATSLAVLSHLTQIREHAASLLGDGFISRTGIAHLGDLSRYLQADLHRLEKLPENPRRDEQLAWQIGDLEQYWSAQKQKLSARRRAEPEVQEIDWLLEELRVSLFAQTLGTAQTVSDKRIRKAIAELAA